MWQALEAGSCRQRAWPQARAWLGCVVLNRTACAHRLTSTHRSCSCAAVHQLPSARAAGGARAVAGNPGRGQPALQLHRRGDGGARHWRTAPSASGRAGTAGQQAAAETQHRCRCSRWGSGACRSAAPVGGEPAGRAARRQRQWCSVEKRDAEAWLALPEGERVPGAADAILLGLGPLPSVGREAAARQLGGMFRLSVPLRRACFQGWSHPPIPNPPPPTPAAPRADGPATRGQPTGALWAHCWWPERERVVSAPRRQPQPRCQPQPHPEPGPGTQVGGGGAAGDCRCAAPAHGGARDWARLGLRGGQHQQAAHHPGKLAEGGRVGARGLLKRCQGNATWLPTVFRQGCRGRRD